MSERSTSKYHEAVNLKESKLDGEQVPKERSLWQKIVFVLWRQPLPVAVNKWCMAVLSLWLVACSYLILLYGLKFDISGEQINNQDGVSAFIEMQGVASFRWVVCTILTVVQHALIEQPGRIVATSVYAALAGTELIFGFEFMGGW